MNLSNDDYFVRYLHNSCSACAGLVGAILAVLGALILTVSILLAVAFVAPIVS